MRPIDILAVALAGSLNRRQAAVLDGRRADWRHITPSSRSTHATRAVEILGATRNPTAEFMKQIARNVTDTATGFLRAKRYLVIDRETHCCDAFKQILRAAGATPVRIPASSPNCNVIGERFVLSIKSECLDRFVLFGTDSLRRATSEFVVQYLSERNHKGIGNQLIALTAIVGSVIGRVRKKERLGGLLNVYRRAA